MDDNHGGGGCQCWDITVKQFIKHYVHLQSIMLSEGALFIVASKNNCIEAGCSGRYSQHYFIYNSVNVEEVYGDRCQCRSLYYPTKHSDCL